MALANCGECGEKVSNRAKHCPHCGVPLGDISMWRTIWLILALLILGGLALDVALSGLDSLSVLHIVTPITLATLTLLFWYHGQR